MDDLAFIMSMASRRTCNPGSYMMNTGFITPGFPAMGAWVSYALGSLSENLPAFVVMPDPRGLPRTTTRKLLQRLPPVAHAGMIKPTSPTPIADLFPPKSAKHITPESEREGLALLNELNREHAASGPATRGWSADRVVRAGGPDAAFGAGRPGHFGGVGGDEAAVRAGREGDGGVRPARTPHRPADAGAGRAVRAGVERRWRAHQQLGQPRQHRKGITADGRRDG